MDDTTYPIGTFSTMTRISIRMLRHYDERGVLVPAYVDPATGYRRYSPEQIERARRIRTLRDVGFGVSSLAALLALDDGSELHRALLLQRDALSADVRLAQQRLAAIDQLINQEEHMTSITERIEDACTLVTLRGIIPTYADEGLLWQQMMPELERQGLRPTGPCGCIDFNGAYVEHDVDEAIFVPVRSDATASEPLEVVAWPSRRVLVATHVGPYHLLGQAHEALAAACAERGVQLVDHAYNRYLTDPAGPEDEHVTEVVYPIA